LKVGFKLTATQADGLTITGNGPVDIIELEDKLDADLSKIAATTTNVDADLGTLGSLTFTGKLGDHSVTFQGTGTFTLGPPF